MNDLQRAQVRELQDQGLDEGRIASALQIEPAAVRQYMILDELGALVPRDLAQEAVGKLAELMRTATTEGIQYRASSTLLQSRIDVLKAEKGNAGSTNILIFNQELDKANVKMYEILNKVQGHVIDVPAETT